MSGKVEIEYVWNRDRIETEMYESRNKKMEGTWLVRCLETP